MLWLMDFFRKGLWSESDIREDPQPEPASGDVMQPEPASRKALQHQLVFKEIPSPEPVFREVLPHKLTSGEVLQPELAFGETLQSESTTGEAWIELRKAVKETPHPEPASEQFLQSEQNSEESLQSYLANKEAVEPGSDPQEVGNSTA